MMEVLSQFATLTPSTEEARVLREPSEWHPMLRTHGLMPRYDEDEAVRVDDAAGVMEEFP